MQPAPHGGCAVPTHTRHPCRRHSASTSATFSGTTTAGVAPTPVVATFPAYYDQANATFDASWTGVTSVTTTTTGGSLYTVELWALYYTAL